MKRTSPSNSFRNKIINIVAFSTEYTLMFIVAERIIAPLTGWGAYRPSTIMIWNTPLFLIPIWFLIAGGTVGVNFLLELRLHHRLVVQALLLGIGMCFCSFLGETLGSKFYLWSFAQGHHSFQGTPLWIPLAYGIAFSFSPTLYRKKYGGILQVVIIAVCWLVFSTIGV